MATLTMKQKIVFDKEVLPHLRIYGDIEDGYLSVFLASGRNLRTQMLLHRKDIEALLPVFKELLEVS